MSNPVPTPPKGGDSLNKLFGLGMTNIIGLFFLFVILIIVVKVVLTKHPVKGVTELVNIV